MPGELTPQQARKFYDRFGARQDAQGFYEDKATADLVAHAGFEKTKAVFEFGCGTGRFAQGLLAGPLPAEAKYFGVDISPKMVELARARLQNWQDRAEVQVSQEEARLALADNSIDHFVSNYVFDLLSPAYIGWVLEEARRGLAPDGRLCLVSLGYGVGPLSKGITRLWQQVYKLRPQLVGGCRPIKLNDYVKPDLWQIEYQRTVTAFGIASEVMVARKR